MLSTASASGVTDTGSKTYVEAVVLYRIRVRHMGVTQDCAGTHISLLPVSNTIVKFWGGVPNEIVPMKANSARVRIKVGK